MEEEKRFISLLSDTTFKYLFKNNEYRKFFNYLIKSVTDIDISDFKLYDAELNSGNKKRDYRLDILLVKDDMIISVEMNQFPSESTMYRNRLFVYTLLSKSLNSGENIKNKYVVQVNFNKEKHPFIGKASYVIMDELTKREIKDFKIYDIYLENYKDIIYNGDNKEKMYLSLFTASSYEELRRLAKDEKEALKVLDELERLAINDELGAVYDNEIMQKKMLNFAHDDGVKEGRKEGIEEGISQGRKFSLLKIFLKMVYQLKWYLKIQDLVLKNLKIYLIKNIRATYN